MAKTTFISFENTSQNIAISKIWTKIIPKGLNVEKSTSETYVISKKYNGTKVVIKYEGSNFGYDSNGDIAGFNSLTKITVKTVQNGTTSVARVYETKISNFVFEYGNKWTFDLSKSSIKPGTTSWSGWEKADKMIGSDRADIMTGWKGNDILDPGKGNDRSWGEQGKDKFYYRKGYDKDRIEDFQNNKDTVVLDDNLWSGTKSVRKVLNQFGHADGNGNFVLKFGNGDVLKILDTTKAQLMDDVSIV